MRRAAERAGGEALAADGSLTGWLLVASPALDDPNFHRTVVLVCAHEEGGAFGVVLNRPLEADLLDHLPQWRHLASSPAVIFFGGPVGTDGAVGLGLTRPGAAGEGWTAVTDRLGLFDLGRAPEEMAGSLERFRVFSGHAGWTAGQLEAEIERESWFVVDSEPGDPFSREPQRLWREVLRRQPGRLAMFADFPVDPAVN